MQTTLKVPFVDTAPDDLCFTLAHDVLPALATATVRTRLAGADVTLELRLLGASHQAVLHVGATRTLVETLACLPGRPAHLPGRAEHAVGHLAYEFTTRTEVITDRTALSHRVAAVRGRAAVSPHGLVGTFPGDPDAVTVLLAEPAPDRLAWATWHVYPGNGLVRSRTEVRHGAKPRPTPSVPRGASPRGSGVPGTPSGRSAGR